MRVFSDLNSLPAFSGTVITIGSFDGVHTGHRRILEQVRQLARSGGAESVVITFDPHPRTLLHPDDPTFKLLNTTAEKIALIEACGIDNVVVVPFTLEFAQQPARAYVQDFLVRRFRPRTIVIGYDHRFGNNREGDIRFLEAQAASGGYDLMEIPAQEIDDIAVSSTKIRRALDAANVAYANRLLGYSYRLHGRVVAGQRLGRTIGFPTANLKIDDPYKLLPPAGIYAARAGLGADLRPAMLYIGHRPTVEGSGDLSIEVHLLDFDGDLYDQWLTVEVVDFIREDRKMQGLEELGRQIAEDREAVIRLFSSLPPAPSQGGGDVMSTGDSSAMERSSAKSQPKKNAEDIPAPPPWEGVGGRLAIVILNYNTRHHLEAFLPSVVAHSPGARIVVADNGSPDDSVAFLRAHYPTVEVLDLGRNYGFAQGYNEALRQVQAEYYVILNSDVEVTPGWIEPILSAMQADPSIAVAQPKILSWRQKTRFEYAGAAGGWIDNLGYPFCRGRIFSYNEEDRGQYDDAQPCFWAAGAAFFIRAELYHAFGGFDGDYFAHNEEIDLCWRLKRAGYSVWCFPQSVVYHLGGGTLEYESPRKVFLNFRNSLFTLMKNKSIAKLAWLLPARLVLDGLAAVRFLLKGQPQAIGAILRAHISFYGHWKITLRKRRQTMAILEKYRIRPKMDRAGMYPGSIVFKHYGERVKEFSKL